MEEEKKQEVNPVEQAQAIVDRMKQENDRAEQLLKQKELILSKEILSGRSTAGQTPIEKNPEDIRREQINAKFGQYGIKI